MAIATEQDKTMGLFGSGKKKTELADDTDFQNMLQSSGVKPAIIDKIRETTGKTPTEKEAKDISELLEIISSDGQSFKELAQNMQARGMVKIEVSENTPNYFMEQRWDEQCAHDLQILALEMYQLDEKNDFPLRDNFLAACEDRPYSKWLEESEYKTLFYALMGFGRLAVELPRKAPLFAMNLLTLFDTYYFAKGQQPEHVAKAMFFSEFVARFLFVTSMREDDEGNQHMKELHAAISGLRDRMAKYQPELLKQDLAKSGM